MPKLGLHSIHGDTSLELFYVDKGEGKEAIFFIHGWQQNARDCFGAYLDEYMHSYRVFAPDLPGHGQSSKSLREDYSVSGAFHACQRLIRQLSTDIENITIVGHSLGAFIALKLALIEKKRINRLVLISPVVNFLPYETELYKMIKLPQWVLKIDMIYRALNGRYPFGDRKQIYDIEKGHRIPSRWSHYKMKMKNHPLPIAVKYMKSLIGTTLEPLLKNNHLPTLLIYGAKDWLTPAEFGSSIANLMPQAILRIVKNGGHNLQLTNRNEVMNLINEFIEDQNNKSRGWRKILNKNWFRKK